jgi:large subunit ribosomal protein L18
MYSRSDKNADRQKRHLRLRNKVVGSPERPRLNVYRSLNHIYAQVIDDRAGNTLASASSVEKDVRAQANELTKKETAKLIGKLVAQRALEQGVKQVVFDRGGYIYTGRVATLAEGAREAGLEF